MQMAGSVVLVTGASGGIGGAVATRLHRRGARLLVHGRGGPGLDALADQCDATPLAVDFTHPDGGERLAEKALSVYGRIDAVVHSAGIGHFGALAAAPPGVLDRLVDVNVRAPLQLTRCVLPQMLTARSGHLAFLGSIAGLTGVASEAAYSATKSAVSGLVESLTLELAGSGVGVSIVCPGPVDTHFFAARGAPYGRGTPRPIAPGRVADLVLRGLDRDGGHDVVPRWLGAGPAVRTLAPRLYYPLARRFG